MYYNTACAKRRKKAGMIPCFVKSGELTISLGEQILHAVSAEGVRKMCMHGHTSPRSSNKPQAGGSQCSLVPLKNAMIIHKLGPNPTRRDLPHLGNTLAPIQHMLV